MSAQCHCSGNHRIVAVAGRRPRRVPERNAKAATGACVGLGVKAPVGRIVVFLLARRTHRETPDRGPRPIVRDVFDDAVAWPAMRAVNKRIPVAPIRRIEKFGKTFATGGQIRQHLRAIRAGRLAGPDLETLIPTCWDRAGLDGVDGGMGGGLSILEQFHATRS